jgi:predicted glycoside hydrolase/deacetylase ChbG (UPF0249 family)
MKTVILHADDVGMCHGANRAYLDLFRAGRLDSGSVMVPCPWFPEIAAVAREDSTLDLGVHLTLTSEWPSYRWGPISTRDPVCGLMDRDGYFPPNVATLRAMVKPEAARDEMRAQIERALAMGIDATHLDTHMGAALAPEILPHTLALAGEYRLPLLLPREIDSYLGVLKLGEVDRALYAEAFAAMTASGMPAIDRFAMTPNQPVSAETYRPIVVPEAEGVTFVSLHPNAPGDIEAITAAHPRQKPEWRIGEYERFGDGTMAALIAEHGVARTGFRALRDAWRS